MGRQILGQSEKCRYGSLQDVRNYVGYIDAWIQEACEELSDIDKKEGGQPLAVSNKQVEETG